MTQVRRFLANRQGRIIGYETVDLSCKRGDFTFCDSCGDCVICDAETPCPGGWEHRLVRYLEE